MDPATSRPSRSRSLATLFQRASGSDGLPSPPNPAHPAGDHQKLALVRFTALGAMAVLLPPILGLLGYGALVLPIFLGALVLLGATVAGYTWGNQTQDVRGAWLFYAAADTLVILTLGVLLGNFMDVFLIVVVVELARIYRHGKLVIAGSIVAALLMLGKFGLLQLFPAVAALGAGVRPPTQALLLVVSTMMVVLICAVSLSTFIQHYAREIFSYERIQAVNAAELHVAHEIQSSLMAPRELESGQWSIAAISVPAKEVGGDFYEYIPALGNSIGGIAIGDVSGKGIPAALQMAVVRTIFRIEARRRIFPAETLTRVNQSLQTEMQTQGMVTLLYAFVDPLEGVMHYANAGHNYPVVINDHVEELKLAGLPLGVDGDTEYDERSVPIHAGTSVVFYTDGVVEAFNEQGELFGFDRLLNTLYECRALSPKDLVHFVVDQVQTFAGSVPQSDDITIVVLHHGSAVTRPAGKSATGGTTAGESIPLADVPATPVALAPPTTLWPAPVPGSVGSGTARAHLTNGKGGGER
ncbi:MAG TPA: PP2C family protein-serine/threonine phosphatase [Chloroflexia bacterium]|nr:PP2C family protein-serine/threonine phosphatase [Chloroflexia bacterium]